MPSIQKLVKEFKLQTKESLWHLIQYLRKSITVTISKVSSRQERNSSIMSNMPPNLKISIIFQQHSTSVIRIWVHLKTLALWCLLATNLPCLLARLTLIRWESLSSEGTTGIDLHHMKIIKVWLADSHKLEQVDKAGITSLPSPKASPYNPTQQSFLNL